MDSHFITKPNLDFFEFTKTGLLFGNKFRYGVVLEEPLLYYSEILQKTILVPSGFRSDGASVPQIFWSIYPPFGKYLYAAIIHDYFYYLGRNDASYVDKATADLIFKEAMIVLDVKECSANIMYNAVKYFGYEFDKDKDNTIVV